MFLARPAARSKPTVRPRPRELVIPPTVSDIDAAIRCAGSELEPRLREGFGRQFGTDFSAVRVHTDPASRASAVRLGAAAYAVGNDIIFRSRFAPHTAGGQRLLAHELAHVVQQGGGQMAEGPAASGPSDVVELEADQAAKTALVGSQAVRVRSRGVPGPLRQVVADPFDALRTPQKKLTTAEAKAMLDHYQTLLDDDRDAILRAFHHVGVIDSGLARWLAALDVNEAEQRRALLSDIAERVQRLTVEQQTHQTLTQLGTAQAAFMRQGDTQRAMAAAAAEAAKTGQPSKPVTSSDIAREHEREARRTSPISKPTPDAWKNLGPVKQAEWNARAVAVIPKVVEACRKEAPELGITAANLLWDPKEIWKHGSNVYALSGNPIRFGTSFIETVEADPRYVVRTVVHEIRGHPDFGERYSSYEARIYAEAHRQDPSVGGPVDVKPDKDIYGYIGTEMYAALREVPYERQLSPEHAGHGLVIGIPPEQNIDNKIGLIKSKYAPGIAEAVLQGLYERFRIDPRITEDALALFETVAARHFPHVLQGVPRRGPETGFDLAAGLGVERAGTRSFAYTSLEANAALRWSRVALSAGLRFEAPVNDKAAFIRLGVQSQLHARLFASLYGDLRGGYVWGVSGGTSSGYTLGGGVSYRLGPAQLGLVYDYLKAADAKDPDAHRAFLTLGLQL
jgi:Domain of unknown function (DUF4157)